MPRFATALQINLSPLASRDAPARSPDPPEAMENGRRMVFSGVHRPPQAWARCRGHLVWPVPSNHMACCGLPGLTAPNLSRSPVQSSEGRTGAYAKSVSWLRSMSFRHPHVASDLPQDLLKAVPLAPRPQETLVIPDDGGPAAHASEACGRPPRRRQLPHPASFHAIERPVRAPSPGAFPP